MRYSLRSLMIVVLVLPPLIEGTVWLTRLVHEEPWRNVMTPWLPDDFDSPASQSPAPNPAKK